MAKTAKGLRPFETATIFLLGGAEKKQLIFLPLSIKRLIVLDNLIHPDANVSVA